jgi:putative endopeptidase
MSTWQNILRISLITWLVSYIGPAHAQNIYGPWGINLEGMDLTKNPGDDFYGYVNGTWGAVTEIPGDKTRFGSFTMLSDEAEKKVREIVVGWTDNADLDPQSDEKKGATLYRDFLDEERIQALDAKPVEAYIEAIKAVLSHDEMARVMGSSVYAFGNSFFGLYVSPDAKNPKEYAAYLFQAGLGLPDRDYYLENNFKEARSAYEKYIQTMLTLIGWDEPSEKAAQIISLESSIAHAHWTQAESRDRERTYNPMTIIELAQYAPQFPWQEFFSHAQLETLDRVIAVQNTTIPKLAQIFSDTSLNTLQAWAAFHAVDQAAPLLSNRFVNAHWEFHAHTLQGARVQTPRWKRAIGQVEKIMGETIGRSYVAKYFPADYKARMEALVNDLLLAYKIRIENLWWMSQETKVHALEKLAMINTKIGYPSRWRDYSGLDIKAGDVVGNAARSAQFEWERRLKRIGQEVDKEEWQMTPQTVNAYYDPELNEIVFPAAILQPPFFNPQADAAVNYGSIGGVIGHEITHGFDDQGRKSDGSGILRDWWTPDDVIDFEEQASKIKAHYEALSLPDVPDLRIDGDLTMGENIADLGGILLGLEAYKLSSHWNVQEDLDGFSPQQRVFLGWAQIWRTLMRPESRRQLLVSDPHSPGDVRAFAPLCHVDEFYQAFNITEGDALFLEPEARARIW